MGRGRMPGNRDGNPVESVAEPKPSLETSAAVALTRAEELRRLSRERWQSQLQLQQRERAAESTSGHLFNRADPYCEERDAFVEPYVRTKEPDKNGRRFADRRGVDQLVDKNGHFVKPEDLQNQLNETQNRNGLPGSNDDDAQYRPRFENNKLKYVPVSGHDFLSLNPDSRYKYRIPHDSVVNKVGDCKVCCCFGWRLTAAQWIWFLNLLCWFVHTVMVFVTFHYAYWQHKHPNGDVFDMRHDTEHVMVRIFRFSGIPTKEMIDNNLTKWSQDEWRNGTFSKTEFYLKDNDLPVTHKQTPTTDTSRPLTVAPFCPSCNPGQLRISRRQLLCHLVLLPSLCVNHSSTFPIARCLPSSPLRIACFRGPSLWHLRGDVRFLTITHFSS